MDNFTKNTPEYSIERDYFHPRREKAQFDIRLKNKIEEKEIENIANEIKHNYPNYKRYFVSYYLPEMKIGSGAWATSHSNPTLSVRILGASIEEEKIISNVSNVDGDIIGEWIDNSPGGSSYLCIYEKDGGDYFKEVFNDGSYRDNKLQKRSEGYIHPLDDGVTIKIEEDGNLGFYENGERYDLIRKK